MWAVTASEADRKSPQQPIDLTTPPDDSHASSPQPAAMNANQLYELLDLTVDDPDDSAAANKNSHMDSAVQPAVITIDSDESSDEQVPRKIPKQQHIKAAAKAGTVCSHCAFRRYIIVGISVPGAQISLKTRMVVTIAPAMCGRHRMVVARSHLLHVNVAFLPPL